MKRRFSLFTYPMMDMKAAEAELNRRAAAAPIPREPPVMRTTGRGMVSVSIQPLLSFQPAYKTVHIVPAFPGKRNPETGSAGHISKKFTQSPCIFPEGPYNKEQ